MKEGGRKSGGAEPVRTAYGDMTEDEAGRAVERLTDQAELARAARELRHGDAREKAVNKLTDAKLLLAIARGSEADFLSEHTVERVEIEDDTMECEARYGPGSGYLVSYGGRKRVVAEKFPVDLREVARHRLAKLGCKRQA